MVARRLGLTVVAWFCGLACPLGVGVAPSVAATQFGSYGSEAGQLMYPAGVAVDATGDVYVGDAGNNRVDKFGGSGVFQLAWGAGVVDGANELQTCTSVCERGLQSAVTGGFEFAAGVAVDDELSSLSYGDVYVVDHSHLRVEKYDSSGKFLLMFGGHVNATNGGDVCVAGETCQPGAQGTADGEFSFWPSFGNFIAVGPGGSVYVGDKARVEVFDSSGMWKENISLAALSGEGRASALAVDSAGSVYVSDEGVAGVHVFEPGGIEKATQFDVGSTTVTALALDSKGDVFVGDSNGGFHLLEYDAAGTEIASFASKTLTGTNYGLAYSETTKELYATSQFTAGGKLEASVWVLTPPPPGPLVVGESATPGLRGIATLEGTINPENNETTYHFEYGPSASYGSSTPPVSLAPSFEDQSISANLTGLVPGETYHYRLVATNSKGTATGPDQTVQPTPPALIEGPWATNVASTSVTLAAGIDPLGASTEYRLEYGTSTSYGQTLSGNVGEGMGYVTVSHHLQELQPGTTYHYRVVTVSEVGRVEGADHTFTTESVGGQVLSLPDGRAWELVSPPDKKGALIETFNGLGDIQAAGDGSGIAYMTLGPHLGENPVGRALSSQVLSRRDGPGVWSSQDINLPGRFPENETAGEIFAEQWEYPLFSSTLSLAAVDPQRSGTPLLSSEATERTLYLRDDSNGTYRPLVTPANVPAGTKFGGTGAYGGSTVMHFLAGTPDLSHVVFESSFALTGNAPSNGGLYEWAGGQLQLVSVLPDGEPSSGLISLGGRGIQGTMMTAHALSSDGRRIVWSNALRGGSNVSRNYVRDMVEGKTVQLGSPASVFEGMSRDGSKLFFLEHGELYELNVDTGVQSDLTSHHGLEERNAGVQDAVLGASEDGSYAYFVAHGILAEGAHSGEDNLYAWHDNSGEPSIKYVATLSSADAKSWIQSERSGEARLSLVSSRVSPSGRFVAFMSDRSLTGYDNVDALNGQRDEEVYLYDAVADRLVCASCDPTGARPTGVLDSFENIIKEEPLLVDNHGTWAVSARSDNTPEDHWLAGSIPAWNETAEGGELLTVYQPRYLSDSGRLFFNSPDALVPQDTNGLEDVYQYEPAGVGGCTTTAATFSEHSGGCVDLISSGTSSSESAFYDAGENGNDVFFVTASRLSSADYDTGLDVYDAHVCSSSAPCVTPAVSPPACSSGDSCKAAPSPQPETFGPAPSATFSGTGNVIEEAKKSVVKHKAKPRKKKKQGKHKKRKANGKRARRGARTGGASRKGGR